MDCPGWIYHLPDISVWQFNINDHHCWHTIGIQTLKMANLALFPFGRKAVQTERSGGCLYIIMNIIWLLFAGIELATCHLILALIFAITIVGIPFAGQHLKLAYLALVPFGMDIVDKD